MDEQALMWYSFAGAGVSIISASAFLIFFFVVLKFLRAVVRK